MYTTKFSSTAAFAHKMRIKTNLKFELNREKERKLKQYGTV